MMKHDILLARWFGLCLVATLTICAYRNAWADMVTYNGGEDMETAWQAAIGTTHLEDFESYTEGTQITSLPMLGITFDELAGSGYPFAYLFSEGPPHGSMHLGNFPNGINSTNQWDSIIMRTMSGCEITAFGFWNGDGQSDNYVATAYDVDSNVIGSIGAYKDTFAGCVSDVAIAYVIFDGDTGDGWNHLDGLQTNAVNIAVPEPSMCLLMATGGICAYFVAWRRRSQLACPYVADLKQDVSVL